MRTKLASFMIVLSIFLAFAATVQAAPAGKVTNIDGRVDVTAPGKPAKALSIGDEVNVGDIVRTKSGSKCEITWNDGSIARLAENSRLQVTEFTLAKENRSASFSLFRGKMHNIVTSVSQLFGAKGSSKYEVHTPTSVCGVRGTRFFVYHQEGVSGALFTEGRGYGYSKGRPDAVRSITPGRMMIVTSSSKPAALREASANEINKFTKDTTLSEKKKDQKKDGGDKDKGGGGSSSSGGSGSSSSSGSSSGSGSGDSSSGGTSGSTSGDSTSGSGTTGSGDSTSGGTTSGSSTNGTGTGGSASGDSTGGTTLGGTTLGTDPTLTGSTTGGTTSTPGTTTTGTTPTVVVPIVTQTETSTSTSTTFTQSVTLGTVSGTLDGSIDDTTNEGSLNMSGTGQAATSISTITAGSMSDGSTHDSYLAGMPGSWSGLFTGLTYKGGSSSILKGNLSDANYTDSGSESTLSATGTITRSTGYTVSGSLFDIYNGTLVPLQYFNSTDYYGQGYNTSAGGLIAVWTFARTGGSSPFLETAETLPFHYYEYCPSTPFAYIYESNLMRTDDGSGHFEIAGDIRFMNDRYYGLINMKTKAVQTGACVEGYCPYDEIGVGNYVLDPLKYHGYWGTSGGTSLYYNNSGSLTYAGHEEALIGGINQAPWTGSTDFKAIGEYGYNSGLEGYTYYLWNTSTLYGYDPSYSGASTGGYFEGITAGIWGSSKKGSMRAIYVTPVASGSSTAGILTSDDIAVTLYSDDGMWTAAGTLGPVSGLTYTGNPVSWTIDSGSSGAMKLKGSFTGSSGSSVIGNGSIYTMFLIAGSASPSWGIYNMALTEANTYSGKPLTGDAAWSADLGGEGQFGYGSSPSSGYWIASITDGAWTQDGQITGTMSGTYLTPTYKGTIVSSPFYGVNSSSGNWIGESIGIYQGTALKFASYLSPYIWSYNGTWYNETTTSPGYYEVEGLLGGTDSLWNSSSVSVYALGKASKSGSLVSDRHIFNSQMYSYNYNNSTKTTYDGGSYYLLYAGNEVNNELNAYLAGLYIYSGKAGFLTGNISGNVYTDIAMWEAEGTLTKEEKESTTISAANLYNNLWGRDDADHLNGSIASISGSMSGSTAYNRIVTLYDSTGSAIMGGGIWQFSSYGSGFTPSASWTAKAGGDGIFGPYHNGTTFVDDSGYWIADFESGTAVSHALSATVSGTYITRNHWGTMNGNLLGNYNDNGTWSAASVGTYLKSENLAFSTGIDWGSCGYFDLDPQSGTYNTMVYGDPDGTYLNGIIGSVTSFVGASASLKGIGTYYTGSTYPLWEMNISKNLNAAFANTDTISLWFGGTKTSTSFKGKLMGLYANWNGTNYDAGYLTSGSVTDTPVTGNLYSGIGMWEITAGSLISSAKDTLSTEGNVTPAITMTQTERSGSTAGTQGISGTSNSFDMYFSQTNSDWGIWRAESGGTYTGTPTSDWYGATGEKDEVNNNYSISHLTGTAWADGEISGTSSGRYLNLNTWGRSIGDIVGVYDSSAKTWQTLALGKREKTGTLAFSGTLTGNLYEVVAGTVYNKEYQRPYWTTSSSSSSFSPLRYETVYFIPEGGSYSPTTSIGFEWDRQPSGSSDTYKNEYHYFPNGKWIKILKGQGVTHDAGTGDTSGSLDLSDPSTSPNFAGTIVADPATPFISNNNYVAAYNTTWNTNALVQNGSFKGILGGLDNVSLWSSTSSSKTNLILMGSHDAYNGSQLFGTPVAYTSSGNGAFYGVLAGIIRDTDTTAAYSENPLEGLIVGLYVDPSGNAGTLKGNFTGTSYTGINMWESTDTEGAATLYRYSTNISDNSMDVANVAEASIVTGNIGVGINSAVYGTFGENGSVRSPYGIMGKTYSIDGKPCWGIFTLQVGIANTFENPSVATSWTSELFGSGMFGQYSASYGNYTDLGYWHTDLTSGTWSGGKLTGTLDGDFITYKKIGTMEGSLLGTYEGTTSGIWQATAAGTYVKTQDVVFSSEIWGNMYSLTPGNTGSKSVGSSTYNFWYNDEEGPNNYGNSTYYNSSANTKTITRFDVQGPTAAQKYHKDVWVQRPGNDQEWDTADDTYTFSTTVYDTVAAYNTAMADLQKYPGDGSTVDTYSQYQFHTSDFNGIMAGVDNLWTNIGNASSTTVYMMGDFDIENTTPKLFRGTVVSFNPLVNLNPYDNSTSPIGGAYFAYLGGAFGKKTVDYDTLDGIISGIYLASDGSAGILDGTLAGSTSPNLGYWSGSGEINGYKLLASTKTVTSTDFGSILIQSSSQYNWTGPDYLAADSYLGDTSGTKLAYIDSKNAYLDYQYYDKNSKDVAWSGGMFGVFSFTSGGTYTSLSDSNSFAYTMNNIASYIATDWATTSNSIRSGSQHEVKADYSAGVTTILGADIKGLFDPVKTTWQIVGNGKFMETTAFVNLINSLTTSAEKEAFMAAMKIPCINVGQVDLSGSGISGSNTLSVNMNNVAFYAYSTGQTPKIFASKDVSGSYASYGGTMPTVNLTASNATNLSNVSATFTPTVWNTSGGKWGAEVKGTATMASPSTNIVFKGGAAGTLSGSYTGSFSGTTAGVVR